ncbi:MAG: murein biosynthesis integral membrane protein MurJ, partial [Candidatus Gracilibacteria bacterium]
HKFFRPISVGGASALIAITSLASYALGLVRDRVIAVNFGTSSATDTYNASFLIPDILFNVFIAGALAAAFLPVFTDYQSRDKTEANRIASSVLTVGSLNIAILSVILFIFMDRLVPFVFTTATPQMQQDIVFMTRIMLPSAILFSISNALGNILMSYKHFISYSISPILYNLGIILGILFFGKEWGIYAAAAGVVIGGLLHCGIRIIDTFSTGFRFKPAFDIFHPAFLKILKLMIPRSFGLIAWQINLYIFAIVGIRIMEGGLAAFNFARNIQSFAVSLFGISFATAIFPHLSESAGKKDFSSYTDDIQKTIQRILFFTIPSMVGIMVLSGAIVNIILGGGVFDQNSVKLTSIILFAFAFSIPFESINHILARAFYSLQNTITPTIVNVIAMGMIAFSTIYLAPRYGISWFSFGFSIAYAFQVVVLVILLRKKLQGFNLKNFSFSLAKIILASGIMAIVLILSEPISTMMNEKLADAIRICIGGLSFFAVAYAVKAEELNSIKYIFAKLLRKPINTDSKLPSAGDLCR